MPLRGGNQGRRDGRHHRQRRESSGNKKDGFDPIAGLVLASEHYRVHEPSAGGWSYSCLVAVSLARSEALRQPSVPGTQSLNEEISASD